MSVQEIRLANSAPTRIAKIPFKGEEQSPIQTEEPSKQEGHGLLIGALATAAVGIAGIALYHKFNKKAVEEVGNAIETQIKTKQAKLKELGEAHAEKVKKYYSADEADQAALGKEKSQLEYEINTIEEELKELQKKPAA